MRFQKSECDEVPMHDREDSVFRGRRRSLGGLALRRFGDRSGRTWRPVERLRAAAEPTATVSLLVDFGDGVEVHFTRLAWKKGLTVTDAIALAGARGHGVKFTVIGSGETALVTQIGDVKNEGAGRNRRNWLYSLNGQLSDNGAGAQTLAAGDRVLWKFERVRLQSYGRQMSGGSRSGIGSPSDFATRQSTSMAVEAFHFNLLGNDHRVSTMACGCCGLWNVDRARSG